MARHAVLAALALIGALLLLAPPCSATSRRELHASLSLLRAAYAKPNYTLYHRKAAALTAIADIVANSSGSMQLQYRTAQSGGYSVRIPVVSAVPGGQAASSSATNASSPRTRILVSFGQHAREYVTVELALRFLRTLAQPETLRPDASSDEAARTLASTLERHDFLILPMENPNGRDLVEDGGKLCERKNGRGVDANRNWDIDWGKKEKDYDPGEEFPGAAPFSEPETQLVLALAREYQPHVWLNVHSGMEALFTPYDHKAAVPNGPGEQARRPAAFLSSPALLVCVPAAGEYMRGHVRCSACWRPTAGRCSCSSNVQNMCCKWACSAIVHRRSLYLAPFTNHGEYLYLSAIAAGGSGDAGAHRPAAVPQALRCGWWWPHCGVPSARHRHRLHV